MIPPERLATLQQVYGGDHSLDEELDRSLDPRPPSLLLDVAGEHLGPDSRILDVGCRDARHLIALVQAHGCAGVGIDPLPEHVRRARAAVAEAGLEERVRVREGAIERIDAPAAAFDLVWCRDVLELVEGLEQGLAECARVLAPGGRMLAYVVVATERLEPREAAMLHEGLGNVPRNFDLAVVEGAFAAAGLAVERLDVIGTEWREYEEERTQPVSRDLLRLARLRRRRAALVARHGQEEYTTAEASLHWLAYLLLGKLEPRLYVLRKG